MKQTFVEGDGWRLQLGYEAPTLTAAAIGGENTGLRVSSAYWLKIAEALQTTAAESLLFIDQMQGEVMSVADLERFFDLVGGHGLESVRIAYVEGRADQVPRMEMAELMARERGFSVRVFSSVEEAEVWLRHGIS